MDTLRDTAEVRAALRLAEISLAARMQALTIYGLMGISVGLATIFTGAQPPVEQEYGVWARVVLGAMAAVGGLFTMLGGLFGDRVSPKGWVATVFGTVLFSLWAIAVSLAYIHATVATTGVHFSWPPEAIDPSAGRLFVPLLYQGIAALIILHVITLLRMGRPHRP